MADGDLLLPDAHVVRYCKPSQADKGVPLGAAFLLEGTHAYLSVTWIEHITAAPERINQLRAVRDAMVASRLALKPNGWLAVTQVERITSLTQIAGTALKLAVQHHPEDGNPGHSGVHEMPAVGSLLATALGLELAKTVTEPAVQVKAL